MNRFFIFNRIHCYGNKKTKQKRKKLSPAFHRRKINKLIEKSNVSTRIINGY